MAIVPIRMKFKRRELCFEFWPFCFFSAGGLVLTGLYDLDSYADILEYNCIYTWTHYRPYIIKQRNSISLSLIFSISPSKLC
jgi:hypothetical protein